MDVSILMNNSDHEIEPLVTEITRGVWYVECDMHSRMTYDASGSPSNDIGESFYFGYVDEDKLDIAVELNIDINGTMYGEMSKTTFRGTFYAEKAYDKVLERITSKRRHVYMCTTCGERPAMSEVSTICYVCDRDEWRDATLSANKRFQYSERLLKELLLQAGGYLRDKDLGCPCNYEELAVVFKKLNNA